MKNGSNGSKWFNISKDSRSWEEFYRKDGIMITAYEQAMVLTVAWHVVGRFL